MVKIMSFLDGMVLWLLIEWLCVLMFECIYGVCKNSGISCDCDDGYIGLFCFERLVIMI